MKKKRGPERRITDRRREQIPVAYDRRKHNRRDGIDRRKDKQSEKN